MATYIFNDWQVNLIKDALRESYIKAHDQGITVEQVDELIEYMDNPYNGSWMGQSNKR